MIPGAAWRIGHGRHTSSIVLVQIGEDEGPEPFGACGRIVLANTIPHALIVRTSVRARDLHEVIAARSWELPECRVACDLVLRVLGVGVAVDIGDHAVE